jgi:putative transposase
MRNQAPDEYSHVFSRGMQKQPIFEIRADYLRFLFLIVTFQGETSIKNISREIRKNVQSQALHIGADLEEEVLKNRMVELVAFCLVPNHFHLILRELVEGGISKYMQRVLTAYVKYFNLRHDKSGHLFQGPYKSVHIGEDKQLLHTSAYIHKHPLEIGWKGSVKEYPWSSYQDYVIENRFGNLLLTNVITDRFEKEYGRFDYNTYVATSPAKEMARITEDLFG